MRRLPLLPSLVALLAATPLAAQSASDDFNRPNGTNMGPDWVEANGDFEILANQGHSKNPFSFGFMHHATLTGNYADSVQSVSFSGTPGGDTLSLLAGLDPATWGAVEARLQDWDGDGTFDRVIMYSAVNAGTWGGSNVVHFLNPSLASGTMTLSFSNAGDTAVVDLDDGAGNVQSFTASGINSFAFPITGQNFGIGGYDATFDDWSASLGPGGPVLAVQGTCGQAGSAVTLSGASSGTAVALVYGFSSGSFAIPAAAGACVGTLLDVASPTLALTGQADASGAFAFQLGGRIPAAACGAVLVQALDVATCATTPVLAL